VNGVHDMGGMHGFGPVLAEVDEPVFHHEWERRAFALTVAMARPGGWTIDRSRHARESLPPAQYLASSYYEIWLAALERLLVEHGLATQAEIEAGRSDAPPSPVPGILEAGTVAVTLARGSPVLRLASAPARFARGDRVRALDLNPRGHTRLPRYVRGRFGTVTSVHGAHVFPDTNAHGQGEQPRWLYGVAFAAQDLWGPDARADDTVHLDLWEPYLAPA
jgi:nitrile hydratase subunit beta